MVDETSQSYPKLSKSAWWSIRKKFQNSLPSIPLTPKYLASILDINEDSSRIYITQLKMLTLLDEENKPTDRAEKWRHDDTYQEVCREIREEIYPRELLSVAPKAEDKAAAARWFASAVRVGTPTAKQMATMYQVLVEADLSQKPDAKSKTTQKRRNSKVKNEEKPAPIDDDVLTQASIQPLLLSSAAPVKSNTPSLHIDIQIHIDSDATYEQIDKIFESMAKHLYKNNDG